MKFIHVQEVSYAYADGLVALQRVNLEVDRGERVAVVGPNGAGKSTLFHLLNGLLKPTSGRVYLDGLPVAKENLYRIRQKVGMVFQDSDDQLFNPTVRQEIAYGLINLRITGEELEQTVAWALDAANIRHLAEKSPHNLSGGEKKRVALASVLAMKPDVLVLDEPTASLDPRGVHSFLKLLNKINKEMGITLIFSSHDTDIIPLLSDRLYLMNAGKILLSGTTAEVFGQRDILRENGLRLPRVAHLIEILGSDHDLPQDDLPLTISQARRTLQKALGDNVSAGRPPDDGDPL